MYKLVNSSFNFKNHCVVYRNECLFHMVDLLLQRWLEVISIHKTTCMRTKSPVCVLQELSERPDPEVPHHCTVVPV